MKEKTKVARYLPLKMMLINLTSLPIPLSSLCKSNHSTQVHPNTTLPLQQTIEAYESEIKKLVADGPVDILTLGLGPDGRILLSPSSFFVG
jgi:Glucosamine-6-phosphate isomerases/6-phosphogluconolactonase